jgi:hypothetical protein
VSAEREVSLDPLLEHGQPPLLEARDLGERETATGEVGERRSTPQRERRCPLLTTSFVGKAFEELEIELAALDPDRVPRRLRHDPVPAESLPEVRDVDLKRLLRAVRGSVLPECVDQPIARDDLVRLE